MSLLLQLLFYHDSEVSQSRYVWIQ